MTASDQIYFEPWDVNRRLADLGLNRKIVTDAVQRGFAAWAACTANHPVSFPGLAGWAETVCALGDFLAPLGWSRIDETGQPLVINSKRTLALTVATGDENTGLRSNVDPCTRSSKGPRTVQAVQRNAWLFPEMEQDEIASRESQERDTWLLLMHRDLGAQEVRCELSRPISIDQEGHIDQWSERIILEPTSFDGYDQTRGLSGTDEAQTGEIVVEIKRRA